MEHLKTTILWDITPCIPLKVNPRFGGTSPSSSGSKNKPRKKPELCFHAGFLLAYSLTLKMEAIYSSETSVDFQRTTRRYIPEVNTLHNIKRKLHSDRPNEWCRIWGDLLFPQH
jgi:hypothetical protein